MNGLYMVVIGALVLTICYRYYAAMTLAIGTTVIIRMGKQKYAWTTLLPLCFLVVTVLTAGVYNMFEFYLPKGQLSLALISAGMMLLVVFIIVDAVRTWVRILRENRSEAKKAA